LIIAAIRQGSSHLDASSAEDIALDFNFALSLKSALPSAGFGGVEDKFQAVGDDRDGFAFSRFFLHAAEMTLELTRIYGHRGYFV
jgi:hypothetical protein